MASRLYKNSPFGVAIHPHIMVADTKFNAAGLYHVTLKVEGPAAEKFRAEIDAAAEAAFKEFFETGDGKDMKPGDKKKFEVYRPYHMEEDDDGNETGALMVDFKQNATIKLRDGNVKDVVIGLYDAAGKEMAKDPGTGSVIRVKFAMRPIPMKSLKQVGVRLDFASVQVKDFKDKGGSSGGFDAVEGYEDDGVAQKGFSGEAAGGEDY